MPSPFPYPYSAPVVVDYTFPADVEADGWVTTADPDDDTRPPWSWWGPSMSIAGANLVWLDGDPFARMTKRTRVFGGFTPNGVVTSVIRQSWTLGTGYIGGSGGGDSIHGTWINGVRGQLSNPILVGGGVRSYTIRSLADDDGNVTVECGLANVNLSNNMQAQWESLTIYDGEPDALSDIIVDSANLFQNFNTPISITRGGVTFDPQEEIDDYRFPGRRMAVVGLHEVVSVKPVLRANAMLTGERQFEIYKPGGTWADHSTISGGRIYTPGALGTPLSSAIYLRDVICIWKRLRNDYIAVHFPFAICRKYGIGSLDADEGMLAIEIEACQDLSVEGATPKLAVPYRIYLLPSTTTAVS